MKHDLTFSEREYNDAIFALSVAEVRLTEVRRREANSAEIEDACRIIVEARHRFHSSKAAFEASRNSGYQQPDLAGARSLLGE